MRNRRVQPIPEDSDDSYAKGSDEESAPATRNTRFQLKRVHDSSSSSNVSSDEDDVHKIAVVSKVQKRNQKQKPQLPKLN